MAHDNLLKLADAVTRTASGNDTAIDTGGMVTGHGHALFADILYSAADIASGSGTTVSWKVQHSDDNSNWYDCASGAADVITLTTTAANGNVKIPFSTQKRYIRSSLVLTLNSGSTPTVTYSAFVSLAATM